MDRWWTYQTERFPLFANAVLSLILTTAAMGYSLRLRLMAGAALPPWQPYLSLGLLASLVLLLFLLQLRVMDEFRVISRDVLYHPHRPVPRGLVTLAELRWLGFASGLFQLGLVGVVNPRLILCLLPLWSYLGLLAVSRRWNQPFHILSRSLGLPLLTFYASAHDWLPTTILPSPRLVWLLGIGYLSALAIELGQRLQSSSHPPQKEQPVSQIAALWLMVVWLLTLVSFKAAAEIQFVVPVTFWALLLLTYSVLGIWRFWAKPNPTSVQRIEFLSQLWAIGLYCNLGILPLWFGGSS